MAIKSKDEDKYYKIRDEKNSEKLNELCRELPSYVRRFLLISDLQWTTRVGYAFDIICFLKFIQTRNPLLPQDTSKISLEELNCLNGADMQEYENYLIEKQLGKSYYNRRLSAVRSLFKYLYRSDSIDADTSQKIGLKKIKDKEKPEIVALDKDEVTELLETIRNSSPFPPRKQEEKDKTRDRDYAIVAIMLYTGIRISECIGLDMDDIDLGTCSARVHRKGGTNDRVYFSDKCAAILSEYIEKRKGMEGVRIDEKSSSALFLSKDNRTGIYNRVNTKTIERMLKDYTDVCSTNKHITPHKLRSTFATNLAKKESLQSVRESLGHSSIQMSLRYSKYSDTDKENARNSLEY